MHENSNVTFSYAAISHTAYTASKRFIKTTFPVRFLAQRPGIRELEKKIHPMRLQKTSTHQTATLSQFKTLCMFIVLLTEKLKSDIYPSGRGKQPTLSCICFWIRLPSGYIIDFHNNYLPLNDLLSRLTRKKAHKSIWKQEHFRWCYSSFTHVGNMPPWFASS